MIKVSDYIIKRLEETGAGHRRAKVIFPEKLRNLPLAALKLKNVSI